MRDLDEMTITDATLEQMATTADPRLKEIMACAVKHLHAFAREISLTPGEWLQGISFLTAVGQKCTPFRQEFILLSDVLGLSTLVNALHDKRAAEEGTSTSLLGPFFRENSPLLELGDTIAKKASGPEVVMHGRVLNAEGRGVPNALVQVWQASPEGLYDLQEHEPSEMDLRGTFRTDSEGRYYFRTVPPRGYLIPMDGPVGDLVRAQGRHGYRPAHIHFLIDAEGYRELVTALYLSGDDHIDSDVVFGVSGSLVVGADKNDPDAPIPGLPSIRYDFHLAHATAADLAMGRVGADPSRILPAAE